MSRIGHDLRNILATAVLISDRLESSADPAVRRVAPRLVETLDRAVRLCGETLSYARSGPPAPAAAPGRRSPSWSTKVRDAWTAPRAMSPGGIDGAVATWRSQADPDQLFRVLFNLAQNALEAMGERGGELRIAAKLGAAAARRSTWPTPDPAFPSRSAARLFEPFAGSSKAAATGSASPSAAS